MNESVVPMAFHQRPFHQERKIVNTTSHCTDVALLEPLDEQLGKSMGPNCFFFWDRVL